MKVMNISGACTNAPVFQRRLRENEKSEYRNDTIQEAFNYLGVKELSMIMHGSCFPVEGMDFGIGSPFSQLSKDVINFEKLHGFNSNQLGPSGKISKADISPYKSAIWARNEMFIDLNELKKDKYANILSDEMTGGLLGSLQIKYPKNNKNYAYSKFYDAFENYNAAMDMAYTNFKKKLTEKDPNAIKLNVEYNDYKKENKNRIIKEGLFQVLKKTYGTGDFRKWESPVDMDLIDLLKERKPEAIERYNYLTTKYKKDINVYSFSQFIADKQMKEHKQYRQSNDFKYIGDLLTSCSDCEEWSNQDVFLPHMRMGCPYGGDNNGPQVWDFPVYDPDKLFNDDGTLGIAGEFLKNKVEALLKDCENVRIDHALGLVDPYVYDDRTIGTGNFQGKNISAWGIDPKGNYKLILEKIVLPAMEKYNIDKENVVWEDVCTDTEVFKDIYINKHKLPGLNQLEWKKSQECPKRNWVLIGSHDSKPVNVFVNDIVTSNDEKLKQEFNALQSAWNTDYLAGFLHWDRDERGAESDAYCRLIAQNPVERVKAKFAEMFMNSEKIQISFADFFGIDKTYNLGGHDEITSNWKLRLPQNYEDAYYENLSSANPTALNLPEILKIAVKAKMDKDYIEYKNAKKENPEQFKQDLKQKNHQLLERLDKFTEILKEKEA